VFVFFSFRSLDSIYNVEIIVALENEFGIFIDSINKKSFYVCVLFFRIVGFEILDADYDKLYTIQAVVNYLVRKMNIVERPKPVVSSASDPRYDEHHH
jgi:acyl carrier protein